MAKKISKDNLNKLQSLIKSLNEAQMQIGAVELQKIHAITVFNNINNAFGKFQEELREKYGEVDINAIDGTIKQKVKDEQADKKNQYW